MLQAQFTRILMTITAIYIVLSSLRAKKKMLEGFIWGIIAVLAGGRGTRTERKQP